MKKILSLILCLATIFSSVAFCVPAIAADIDFGVETGEDQETLPDMEEEEDEAALAEDELTLPVFYDFEDGVVPANITPNDSKTTLSIVEKGEGKALQVAVSAGTATVKRRITFDLTEGVLPAASYKVSFDFASDKYPANGHVLNVYYRTTVEGKITATPITGTGYTVKEDGKLSFTMTFTEPKTPFSIQIADSVDKTKPAATYTIDNFKFEEVPTPATIAFNANGGEGTQESIVTETGATVTLPEPTITRKYYDFLGWFKQGDSEDKLATTYTVSRQDLDKDYKVTFFAAWKRRTFDVNFDFNGGASTLPAKYTINEGESKTMNLPTATEVKLSKNLLVGWTDSKGNEYACGQSVTLTEPDTLTAVWRDVSDYGTVIATGFTGHDGKTKDVDPRYPGIRYTLPTALDPNGVTLGNLNLANASAVEYDEKENVLIVYPKAENARTGSTISFAYTQTMIETADHKSLLTIPAASIKLAATYAGIYDNLFPYGDAEGTYLPYSASTGSNGSVAAERAEENGNHYSSLKIVKDASEWLHMGIYFRFDNGATYKFSGRYRTTVGGAAHFNVSFHCNKDENMPYANPKLDLHQNNWYHYKGIGNSKEWQNLNYEFTVNKISEDANEIISVYTNPSGGKMQTFDLDDFALYKRIDVTYSAGINAELVSGKTAPATHGAYMDGTGTTVTLASECPYEPINDGWKLNTEKPWLDQNGNTYAAGETVDLAETGALTLVPNLTTDKETVTLAFVCDGLNTTMAPIQLVAGDTLDMTKIEDVTPIESGKRFNGWSATGEWKDVLHGKVQINKSMTLYPVISYNFDFAVANNRAGWETSNAKFLDELYGNSWVITQSGGSNDVLFSNYSLSVPMNEYKSINLIFDATYNGDRARKWEMGTLTDGIFFMRAGEGASEARHQGGKISSMTSDGKYAIAEIVMYTNANWVGTLTAMRIDPYQSMESAAIRGIEFVPVEEFDETEIQLSGLTAPVAGLKAVTSLKETSGIANVKEIKWSPALADGRFEELTAYTATITLEPKTGSSKRFKPETTVVLDGEKAISEYDEESGLITVTKTFSVTDAYKNFEFDIVGPESILIDGKPTQYKANFTVDAGVPDKSITWSVDNTAVATVDASTGALTPIKNGTIVLTATSNYNYQYSKKLTVDIDYYDFDMSISGPATILKADRTTQYSLSVICDITLPDMTAIWSVESGEMDGEEFKPIAGASYAIITETGKVIPNSNGVIRVSATSNCNPAVSASMLVTISNQATKGKIVYHPGTTDKVMDMPEEQEAYGTTALSTEMPSRDGYVFLGWATSDESAECVASVIVPAEETVDVYAVWSKGVVWLYGTANKGKEGYQSLASTTGYVGTGADYDEIKPKVGDYRIQMPLNVSAKDYTTVSIRMSSTSTATTQLYYKTIFTDAKGNQITMGYDTNGFAYAEAQSLVKSVAYDGLENFKTVTFDVLKEDTAATSGKWSTADTVVQIYVDPCKTTGQNFRISSIAVLSSPTVTFDKNTTDTVTGMPSATKVTLGSTLTVKETPVREGYTFLGWSKSATERDVVKTTYGIAGDVTLYAVWDKTVDLDPTEDGSVIKYPVSGIEANHTAILVKVGTTKGVEVGFTYTDANGETQTLAPVKTNANGYAVIDLRDVERPISDAAVTIPSNYTATSILLSDYATANATANKVNNSGSSSSGKGGSTGGGKYNYDNTVSDIKNNGKQYEVGGITSGDGTAKSVLSESAAEGTILFNFDEEYEKEFFKELRQMTLSGMDSSVISYRSNGKASGSSDSPALFTGALAIDAATHKYVVVKAKQSGLSNGNLRIYFHNDSTGFSEAQAETQKLGEGDYSMLVYDMGAKEGWKDTISAMFFSLDGDVKGVVDIDWIMFTDKVPESMDEINGAKVNFPVVNKDAMPFTDVKSDDWFNAEVANAYKLGFVEGTTATTFEPEGSVTIAEAITLAVRLNYIYNGKNLPKAATTGDWFKPFVDAAVREGIIKANQFAEYDVPAPRKQVAAIMAKALPSNFYEKMNVFTEVPDLDKKDATYSAVLKLYNAGIVIGSDDKFNFLPESTITRAEIAAIVNRIAEPANRKRVVTEAEIESKKKKYYADDIASTCSLGNCTATKMTAKDGVAWATGKSNDPIVYLGDLLGQINGKEVKKITFGLKWDSSKVTMAPGIFFTTTSGGWAAERYIKAEKSTEHENGIVDYVVTTSANSQFENVKEIRFDPFDAAQEFGIAYIILE